MKKYCMVIKITATTKKIGTATSKGYEQTLMQKLVESEVSKSIRAIIPIRYSGLFVMIIAAFRTISYILQALSIVRNDSIRENSLFHLRAPKVMVSYIISDMFPLLLPIIYY